MKYKTTEKDRYGNMRSIEITTDGQLEVPPMTSMIPQYEAVGGLAKNHPGEPRGSDTVPAWLTPGEFVVNKEAVDLYGPQIKQMNDVGRDIQNGEIPMYAKSGKEVDSMINQIMGSEKAKGGGDQFTHYEGDKPTKYGVTLETYREHINPKATIEDLKNLTEKGAKDIYKKYYYKKYKIDQLPDYMQHNVLDMAINAGPGRAVELLQKEINSTLPEGSKIDVDNFLGPQTIKAANNYNNKGNFDTSYGIARLNYYNKVADNNPLKEKFLEGWQNRTNKFIEPREISLPEPKPNLDAVGNITNLEVEKPTEIPKPEKESSGGIWSYLFGGNNSDDNVQEVDSISNLNEQATKNPGTTYQSGFSIAQNRGGEIPQYLDIGDEVYPGIGKVFHSDPVINKALQEATAQVAKDTTDEEDLGNVASGVPTIPEVPSYNPQGIGEGMSDEEFNKMQTQENRADDLETMTAGYEGAYSPLLKDIEFGSGKPKDYRKIDGEWYRVRDGKLGSKFKPGTLASSPDIRQGNLENIFNRPSDEDIAAKARQALADAGIGNKIIPPAAEVFMGFGNDDGTIMNSMEEVTAKRKDNLDTASKTLVNALEGNDQFLISSAAQAVENASENLGTANISESGQNVNDKVYKRKYAIEEHKDVAKSVETLKTLVKNAKKSGNTVLAETYAQKLAELEIKEREAKTKVDTATAELNTAEANDAQVISDNITPEAAKVIEETTGEKIIPGGSDKNKIEAIAKTVDDNKDNEITNALSSKTGDALLKDSKQDPDKYAKVKGMMGFLFGDLIDQREIGRAIAVYLGSRALGYSHADTIGYVAKNYLKRVDSKNAKMDAFIKANAGKYEKASLAEYKRTGDPNVLIPVGSVARPQGEDPKMYYSKDFPRGKLAYKFKKKLPSGEDIVYWSYDQAGQSRVGAGHHTDARRVPTTIEYDKRIQDNAKIVAGQLNDLVKAEGLGRDKIGETESGVAKWQNLTGVMPSAHAQEIALWAEENGYNMTMLGSGLQTAFAEMSAKAKETGVKESSLIPYLENATIKERLLGQAAELPQAKVGDKIVVMDTENLIELNEQVKTLSNAIGMHPDKFWNDASELWTTKEHDHYKQTGKTWREVYQEEAKKPENEGFTPFALFTMKVIKLRSQ